MNFLGQQSQRPSIAPPITPGATLSAFDVPQLPKRAPKAAGTSTLQMSIGGAMTATRGDDESALGLLFLNAAREKLWQEDLKGATSILTQAPPIVSGRAEFGRLRQALAAPLVQPVAEHDVDRSREYAWLKAHANEYRGRWVALLGDNVVAVASSLRGLREALRDSSLAGSPLVHRLPE